MFELEIDRNSSQVVGDCAHQFLSRSEEVHFLAFYELIVARQPKMSVSYVPSCRVDGLGRSHQKFQGNIPRNGEDATKIRLQVELLELTPHWAYNRIRDVVWADREKVSLLSIVGTVYTGSLFG